MVNGTSSRKFGNDFEIDIIADSIRASINEERLWVGCILGNMIYLSRVYKGIGLVLIELFLDEDQRTTTTTIRVVSKRSDYVSRS